MFVKSSSPVTQGVPLNMINPFHEVFSTKYDTFWGVQGVP